MVQRDGHEVEETHAVEVAGVRIGDVVGVVCVEVDRLDHNVFF